MITPTVGRVLWFHANAHHHFSNYDPRQPMAATVAFVHNDRLVNLRVTDHAGDEHALRSVTLLQDDDLKPEGQSFAVWMPYQMEQAKKHSVEHIKDLETRALGGDLDAVKTLAGMVVDKN